MIMEQIKNYSNSRLVSFKFKEICNEKTQMEVVTLRNNKCYSENVANLNYILHITSLREAKEMFSLYFSIFRQLFRLLPSSGCEVDSPEEGNRTGCRKFDKEGIPLPFAMKKY